MIVMSVEDKDSMWQMTGKGLLVHPWLLAAAWQHATRLVCSEWCEPA